MDEKFFRTVLGDKPASKMGLTYSHEHIVIDDSYVTALHPEFLLNDTEMVIFRTFLIAPFWYHSI